MRKFVYSLFFTSLTMLSVGCSNDDNNNNNKDGKKDVVVPVEQREGRFDKTPFGWEHESLIAVHNKWSIDDHSYIVDGSSVRYSVNTNVYPGGVFTKGSVDSYTFDGEINDQKNPYVYSFDFYSSFYNTEEIDKGKGLTSYSKSLSNMLNSEMYKDVLSNKSNGTDDYKFTECYNYNDVQKAFNNKKLGEQFVNKMKVNANGQNYKSIYLMKVGKVFFNVAYNYEGSNIFKSRTDLKDLYVLKQLYYGTESVYVAIESANTYNEVRDAVGTLFTNYKKKGNVSIEGKEKELLDKASITILHPKTTTSQGVWSTSRDDIFSVLDQKLTEHYYGVPVYLDIRSVDKDLIYSKK